MGIRRFLCDEMLHRLGHWLRGAGHDTAMAGRGSGDAELLRRAEAEDRLLLTRDRGLSQRRGAAGRVILLEGDRVEDQARSLSERLRLDWLSRAFTRCLVCNTPVRAASPEEAAAAPPNVLARALPVTRCPGCRRLYWPGSHEARLRKVFERLQELRPEPGTIP
jgi:uncharacterized protein